MKLLYKFDTRVGTFYIGQSSDGQFHPIFNGRSLGHYAHAWQAAKDLADGLTSPVPGLDDTSNLGIPAHHCEWTPVK